MLDRSVKTIDDLGLLDLLAEFERAPAGQPLP